MNPFKQSPAAFAETAGMRPFEFAAKTSHVDSQQDKAINNFDTLRLFFAIVVVFSHSYTVLQKNEPLSVWTKGECTFGSVSVWGFFIISGFLITQSWQRSPVLQRFLKRRILRIYPAFIVVTFLCVLVVHPLATIRSFSPLQYVLHTLHLTMYPVPNVFPHNPLPGILNGSLWTIPYEFLCYLGVAALGSVGWLNRRGLMVTLVALVLFLHLATEVFHYLPKPSLLARALGNPLVWSILLPFFLAGMLAQLYHLQTRLHTRYAALALLLFVGSWIIPHGRVFSLPILGTYLLLWLAYLPALNRLHLGRSGDFSYGTYLYAYPIQQLLIQSFPGIKSPVMLFLIAGPLSVFAGFCSWHLVEKHFLPRMTVQRLEEHVRAQAI